MALFRTHVPMARLFLSYRRSDTGAYADRLAQRLNAFQFDSVFIDREAIDLGDDYADRIRSELPRCAAVLVLIGPAWLDAKDAAGQRRLDNPADWVRREVAIALAQDLRVIAVLFDSPRKPSQAQAELPPDIRALASKNDYAIDGNYFDRDADYLCRRLEQQLVVADRAAARPALSRPVEADLDVAGRRYDGRDGSHGCGPRVADDVLDFSRSHDVYRLLVVALSGR